MCGAGVARLSTGERPATVLPRAHVDHGPQIGDADRITEWMLKVDRRLRDGRRIAADGDLRQAEHPREQRLCREGMTQHERTHHAPCPAALAAAVTALRAPSRQRRVRVESRAASRRQRSPPAAPRISLERCDSRRSGIVPWGRMAFTGCAERGAPGAGAAARATRVARSASASSKMLAATDAGVTSPSHARSRRCAVAISASPALGSVEIQHAPRTRGASGGRAAWNRQPSTVQSRRAFSSSAMRS